MTEQRSIRSYPADLEIRGDGRTLVGIAAPFDSPADITGFGGNWVETIRKGAFERTIRDRGVRKVKLMVQHDMTALPIGAATRLREDTRGLYAEFRVSNTPRGDEALELVRDSTLDGLSIGFRVVKEDWSRDHTARTLLEIALYEVSVVSHPAYQDALIAGVRAANAPLLTAARARLELLGKKHPQWI